MQQKAVRTGLKSQTTRNILHSHGPKDLAEAFAKAQTVYYDDQYLQLDQNRDSQKGQSRGYSRNWRIQNQAQSSPNLNVNMNCNQPNQSANKTESTNMDSSNKNKQNQLTNAPNELQKRDYDFSRQHVQQPHKSQRINQLQDDQTNPHEGYEGDICDTIPDDLISQHSSQASNETTTSSAFLDV